MRVVRPEWPVGNGISLGFVGFTANFMGVGITIRVLVLQLSRWIPGGGRMDGIFCGNQVYCSNYLNRRSNFVAKHKKYLICHI